MKYVLFALLVSACSPLTCDVVNVDIYPIENKPAQAGRVCIRCEGKLIFEINGEEVTSYGQQAVKEEKK